MNETNATRKVNDMSNKTLNAKAEGFKKSIIKNLDWNGIAVHDSLSYVEDGIVTVGVEVDESKAARAMYIIGKLGHADIVSREDGKARIYCLI